MLELREYQNEAINAIVSRWQAGVTRQLVSLPTGTGKTVVFAALARQLNCRTLIVAHREELVTQAVDKVAMVWPEVDAGVVMADRDEPGRQVVVASIQSACRPKRLKRLAEQDFRLLIIDEAHHAVADTYMKVIDALGFMADAPGKLLVGVTATAKRGDKVALGAVFQEIVFERSISTMIRAGYLADLRGIRVATATDLGGVAVSHGDYATGQLAAVVNTVGRNRIITEAYLEHAAPRRGIAFTVDVKHAQDLASEFLAAGVEAQAVYGDMPKEERRDILQGFSAGEVQVVTNCNLLTEGYDEPSIEALLMARPTRSSVLYTQMVGRGTRPFPGKTECLVLDFTDTATGICTLGTLAGLPLDAMRNGQSVAEAEAEREAAEAGKLLRTSSKVVATSFDLLERSRFRWVPLAGGHYRLSAGDGVVLYLKATGTGRYAVGVTKAGQLVKRLSDTELPLNYAQGVAEDWIRRHAKTILADKSAPWREAPATDKQLAALRKFGITPPKGLTRGRASDLLDECIAKAEARRLRKVSLH